jgi:hypothetical protein
LFEIVRELPFDLYAGRYVEADATAETGEIRISCFIESKVIAVYADFSVVFFLSKKRRAQKHQRKYRQSHYESFHVFPLRVVLRVFSGRIEKNYAVRWPFLRGRCGINYLALMATLAFG